MIEIKEGTLRIHFDGGYRAKRKHHHRYGFVAYDRLGVVYFEGGKVLPHCQPNSNLAEFMALEKATEWAARYHPNERIWFVGDSATVIQCMVGDGKPRRQSIKEIYARIVALKGMSKWEYEWVPRESNQTANYLARIARTPERLPATLSFNGY